MPWQHQDCRVLAMGSEPSKADDHSKQVDTRQNLNREWIELDEFIRNRIKKFAMTNF